MTDGLPPARPRRTRSVRRMLLILVGAYALILALVFLFQRRLIYLPTRLEPDVALQIAAQHHVLPWRNRTGRIIGWHWPASAASHGTVLIAHGNAGSAIDRNYLAEPIRDAADVDVFVLEYPGYGARDGSPTERSLLAAADDAFEALIQRTPVFVVSESLGAGVAAYLAKTHADQIPGLVLFAPYNSLAAVAQQAIRFLPMALVLRDRFDPAAWLRDYRGPIAIVLAGSDEVIPPQFGRRLYDGYAGPKKLEVIPGAHHNDIAVQSAAWWKDVFAFWAHDAQRPSS